MRDTATATATQLRRRAFAEHRAGRFLDALSLYDEALAIATVPADVARIKAGQASTHWARGEIENAAALAEEARELAERAADDGAIADAYVAIALVRAAQGDPQGNARAYDVALQHASRGGRDRHDDPDPHQQRLAAQRRGSARGGAGAAGAGPGHARADHRPRRTIPAAAP